MDPKPVKVSFPDGSEELGILVDENLLDVGTIGLSVQIDDVLTVDGLPKTVLGTTVRRTTRVGTDQEVIEEASFRLRLGPYPAPSPAKEQRLEG